MRQFDWWFDSTAWLTRRTFLRRAALVAASMPAASGLLAACLFGSDDADPVPSPAIEPSTTPPPDPATATETGASTATASAPTATGTEAATETPAPPAATPSPSPTPAPEPQQGGTLNLLGHVDVSLLGSDPVGGVVPWVLRVNIHGQLVRLDPMLMLQPDLAESWEISDDGLAYTFRLRPGVLFHHYQELTAEDVRYTFDYYRDPDVEAAQLPNLEIIDVVETPEPLTVVIRLLAPNAAFLARGGQTMIVAAAHHAAVGGEVYALDAIGCGPFRKIEHRLGEYTLLEAFPEYWGGRPYLDFIKMYVVPDPAVRTAMLQNGEADSTVWPLSTSDSLTFINDARYTTVETADLELNHFPMNNELPQFSDRTVRRAMLHAINRQNVIDEVFGGLAVQATSHLSPALAFYYEPEVVEYAANPDEARRLLDEAGWLPGGDGVRERDGVRLEWLLAVIAGDTERLREAELVAQAWSDIGLRANIVESTFGAAGMRDGELDMALFNWPYGGENGDPDATSTLRSDGVNNFSRYRNPRVDELLDAGLSATNSEERQGIYREIQRIVADEAPFVFMMFWTAVTIFTPRVHGLPDEVLRGEQIYAWCNRLWIEAEQI